MWSVSACPNGCSPLVLFSASVQDGFSSPDPPSSRDWDVHPLSFLYFSFLVPPFRCYSCWSSQVSHFDLFHRGVWNRTLWGRPEVHTVLGNCLLRIPNCLWKEEAALSQDQHLLEKEKDRKDLNQSRNAWRPNVIKHYNQWVVGFVILKLDYIRIVDRKSKCCLISGICLDVDRLKH